MVGYAFLPYSLPKECGSSEGVTDTKSLASFLWSFYASEALTVPVVETVQNNELHVFNLQPGL